MIRERDITGRVLRAGWRLTRKDERNVSMKFYMHGGHYKPQGIYKSVKYDPMNVHAQDVRCNKFLHGNLGAYSIALEKRYGFGILQTLERRSQLHFDYTVPLLEKTTAVAKLGAKEYFIFYESIRPKEEKEQREEREIAKAA
jgi:hypothetical protein